jgi:hypothetical protein
MNNAELFHRWAHQVKPKGKSGNVFYEGPLAYSYGYHFVIANLTGKNDVVLFSCRRYSISTGKHQFLARRATSHMTQIHVPNPATSTPGAHKENLEYLNAETLSAVETLRRARTGTQWKINAAVSDQERARIYNDVFLKGAGTVQGLPDEWEEIIASAREREERHEAKRSELYAVRQKAFAERMTENIAKWRAGESVGVWGVPCMLRERNGECETSQGVKVPMDHAKRAYKAVKRCKETGETFHANGRSIPVGVYKIDSISADGTLRAGCHTITFEEIENFAKGRGW